MTRFALVFSLLSAVAAPAVAQGTKTEFAAPDGVHLRAERVRNNRVATATLERVPEPVAR